ncbi:putative membrane protein [Frankia sp. EI5c]|uniref:TMEM165/GDT1 family protein n=1 Tax=Frankia sp. EI5c TaxID=683316 RepID=UPI0007C2D0BF|nr:TMEM165/GDT1 family protein [Frankia sp. EI5c]OAA26372.1 putative membrane protein [Frankia sp. EI5c]
MSLTALFVTFGVIFLAELPDKTMVASLVLGSRFRPLYVWVGVAAAFLVQVTLAVAAGSVISLLPARAVDVVAALLFALGAALVLREGREDHTVPDDAAIDVAGGPVPAGESVGASALGAGEAGTGTGTGSGTGAGSGVQAAAAESAGRSGFLRVAATSFAVVFVAELGDLTQFSTANLAARYSAPVAVWIGAVLALWTVAAMAIAGGRGLLKVLSVRLITRIAAVAFSVLSLISLIDAIRG